MKAFTTVFCLLFSGVAAFAQTGSTLPPNLTAMNTLQKLNNMSPGDLLYGIPLPEKKLIGDGYLHKGWRSASLIIYSSEKMLEGYPVRYDMLKDEMEVNARNGVKVIEGKKIKSFVWLDSLSGRPQYFINAKEYKSADEDVVITGFFQVLSDGKLPLFRFSDAVIKKANYSIQFDVGSRDDEVIKKEKLYYAERGKVYPVPSGKKKLLPLFYRHEAEVSNFMKVNGLTAGNPEHVERLFRYYNSLN